MIDGRDLSPRTFHREFVTQNRPCVLEGLADHWRARADWRTEADQPDLHRLRAECGDLVAPLVEGWPPGESTEGAEKREDAEAEDWRVGDAILEMQARERAWDAQNGLAIGRGEDQNEKGEDRADEVPPPPLPLYLRDWHLQAQRPFPPFYDCPAIFHEDWLNDHYLGERWWEHEAGEGAGSEEKARKGGGKMESTKHMCVRNKKTESEGEECKGEKKTGGGEQACEVGENEDTIPPLDSISLPPNVSSTRCSDYRFVYCGTRDSGTRLHTDVLKSHSWSTNVAGVKRWRLLPPDSGRALVEGRPPGRAAKTLGGPWGGEGGPPDANANGSLVASPSPFPPHYAIRQLPGQTVFVPSGWWHETRNETACLSINHNWIEPCALRAGLLTLAEERARAAMLLDDCRECCAGVDEFRDLVERNLACDLGMGFADVCSMLVWEGERSLRELQQAKRQTPLHTSASAKPACDGSPGDPSSFVSFFAVRRLAAAIDLLALVSADEALTQRHVRVRATEARERFQVAWNKLSAALRQGIWD